MQRNTNCWTREPWWARSLTSGRGIRVSFKYGAPSLADIPATDWDISREGLTMRATITLSLLLLALVTTPGCGASAPSQEVLQTAVVTALDTLVAELVTDRPADVAAYMERLRAYLEAHPAFYGSAAALLDHAGTVTTSPYVYRTADGYATRELATPTYDIQAQAWVTAPLAANAGVWTAPYFDAGGGEIWMITRSVPARDAEGIFALITTDLPVDAPAQ